MALRKILSTLFIILDFFLFLQIYNTTHVTNSFKAILIFRWKLLNLQVFLSCVQHFFSNFGQSCVYSLSNAYVCSYAKVGPLVTEFIAVLMSRSGNLSITPFDLDHKAGDYHNKTSCITKCVPSQLCSLFRHRKLGSLYKWPSVSFLIFNVTSSVIDFMFFRREYQRHAGKEMHGVVSVLWSILNSSYHDAVFCVKLSFSITIKMVTDWLQQFGRLAGVTG
jgi:hypothetical protein